jgi:hypothetical protein
MNPNLTPLELFRLAVPSPGCALPQAVAEKMRGASAITIVVNARTPGLCSAPQNDCSSASCRCCRPLQFAGIAVLAFASSSAANSAKKIILRVEHRTVQQFALTFEEAVPWIAAALAQRSPPCFRCRKPFPPVGLWGGKLAICAACFSYQSCIRMPAVHLPTCTTCLLRPLPQDGECLTCRVARYKVRRT